MASVTLSQQIDASPEAVREVVADAEPFMAAGGFDEVTVEGDRLELVNVLGLATMELELELIEDPDAELAYEQVDGIFESMETRYAVEPADGGQASAASRTASDQRSDGGTEVTATTEFTLGGVAGSVLDATVIKRQRKREIRAQFDYLEDAVSD